MNETHRKIVQFQISKSKPEEPGLMYALCDDGTLWWKIEGVTGDAWFQEPLIPLDELE